MLDSDGLIKLKKAGLLDILAGRYECIIPKAVYKETIIKGKKELYEDAFQIEGIVEEKIACKEVVKMDEAQQVLKTRDPTSLGQGEKQALHLYFQEEGDAVLSDDRTFLNLLAGYNRKVREQEGVPFITPANAIVELARKEVVSTEQAKEGLDQIKGLIREKSFQKALEDLHGGD